MDKLKENKFVVKAKEIWKKHKILVSVIGGILLLLGIIGVWDSQSKVDPLDGVQHVAWSGYNESWIIRDSERDQIATKIRVAIFKKYGASNQTIKYIQDNPKWIYDSDDYQSIRSDIGDDKTDKAIDEINYVKNGLKITHDNGNKIILKIDIPQDRANKDGIKLVNREFKTD